MIYHDLNSCTDCTTGLNYDVGAYYTTLCNNHANYIKTLLSLNSTPKTINFGSAGTFRAQLPKHLQYSGWSCVVTFDVATGTHTLWLSDKQTELLLAPAHIQKTRIEINEFIA